MALPPGSRLGPYQIDALIGVGGMGEVYRATDANLRRAVAIKVLPDAVAGDADRLARFQREAELLAALNHPNIAHIHGLERADGRTALVMELVDGPTLAARIAEGPLPVDEALAIARQIARALEAAHDRGIVHRDLKPANIKVRPDGVIKVLDFGLAKAVAADSDPAPTTDAPTRSAPTMPGTVMGTLGYMSPEQMRGHSVDRRTDVWAFGCVLYEMLTGSAPFRGDSASDVTVQVLEREPDWQLLPAGTPDATRRLLRRCLTKDVSRRMRDMADIGLELDDSSEPEQAAAVPGRPPARWPLLAGAVVLALLVVLLPLLLRQPAVDTLLGGATFTSITNFEGDEFDAAISPDGRLVTFVGEGAGVFDAWLAQVESGSVANLTRGRVGDVRGPSEVRAVGFSGGGADVWIGGSPSRRLRLLPTVGGEPRNALGPLVINPDWSPDGRSVTYHTREAGDPVYLAEADGANERLLVGSGPGLHQHFPVWSTDGQWIYLSRGRPAVDEMSLWRVRPTGEDLEQLTTDKLDVRYPTPLDATTVLYVAREANGAGPWLWALDVRSRQSARLVQGVQQYTSASASADGRLIVATVASPEAHLWRVPILDRVATEADVERYLVPSARALGPRFVGDVLFYLSSRGTGDGLWRVEDDRAVEVWNGAAASLLAPPAVSPDGSRLAVVPRRGDQLGIEIISADGAERLVSLDAVDVRGAPAWSPDGAWLVTGGVDAEGQGLFKVPVDGGAPQVLVRGEALNPVWSPTRDLIVYLGAQVEASAPLLGIRADGEPVELPPIRILRGGHRFRFLPGGRGLVFMQGGTSDQDFHMLDLDRLEIRRLTSLDRIATIEAFDVTPDGASLVFDRHRQNSNIVLIDRRAAASSGS